jgi:hypothetical protein
MVPSFRVFIPVPTTRGTSGKQGHGTTSLPGIGEFRTDLSDKSVNAPFRDFPLAKMDQDAIEVLRDCKVKVPGSANVLLKALRQCSSSARARDDAATPPETSRTSRPGRRVGIRGPRRGYSIPRASSDRHQGAACARPDVVYGRAEVGRRPAWSPAYEARQVHLHRTQKPQPKTAMHMIELSPTYLPGGTKSRKRK